MDYAIEFSNVWKRFRRGEKAAFIRDIIPNTWNRFTGRNKALTEDHFFWALKDVSLQVKKGEMLGIVGSNGAGKTTMLSLISRILKPNKGTITTRGRISCLVIAGAGFQMDFTGRENIYLTGSLMGMRKNEIDKKFDSIVEFAGYEFPGYEKFIDTPMRYYSSGMFARLGFAIAAHVDPDVLLMDEILAAGDFIFQQRCFEYMNDLKRNGTTVLLVSHDTYPIMTYCNRAIYLKDSHIMADGDPCEIVRFYEHECSKQARFGITDTVPGQGAGEIAMLSNVRFEYVNRKSDGLGLVYGQPIEGSFDYKYSRLPLEDMTFSLVVYRKVDGHLCFRVLSYMHDRPPSKRDGHVKFKIAQHNLLPGDYVFDIEMRSLKSNTPLAVYREQEISIEHSGKYLSSQLCGVYQPGGIHWDLG